VRPSQTSVELKSDLKRFDFPQNVELFLSEMDLKDRKKIKNRSNFWNSNLGEPRSDLENARLTNPVSFQKSKSLTFFILHSPINGGEGDVCVVISEVNSSASKFEYWRNWVHKSEYWSLFFNQTRSLFFNQTSTCKFEFFLQSSN
jgi:hypothetical protein